LNDYGKANEKFQGVVEKHLNEDIYQDWSIKNKMGDILLNIKNLRSSQQYPEMIDKQFLIAEYYNFDLQQPDSALIIYEKISKQYPIFQLTLDSLIYLHDSLFLDTTLSVSTDSVIISKDSITYIDSMKNENQMPEEPTSDSISIVSDTVHQISPKDSLQSIPEQPITQTETSTIPDSTKSVTDSIPSKNETQISKKKLEQNIEKLQNIIEKYNTDLKAKTLFMKFWTWRNKKKDSLFSQTIVDSLESNFPETKYAKAAIKIINNEPYEDIFIQKDPAEEIFRTSLYLYYDEKDTLKSIAFLDSIIEKYAESDFYPKALYFKAKMLLEDFADTSRAKPYLETLTSDYSNLSFVHKINSYFDGKNYIMPEFGTTEYTENTENDTIVTIIDSTKELQNIMADSATTSKNKVAEDSSKTQIAEITPKNKVAEDSLGAQVSEVTPKTTTPKKKENLDVSGKKSCEYIVKEGNILWNIAQDYNIQTEKNIVDFIKKIQRLNNLNPKNDIYFVSENNKLMEGQDGLVDLIYSGESLIIPIPDKQPKIKNPKKRKKTKKQRTRSEIRGQRL